MRILPDGTDLFRRIGFRTRLMIAFLFMIIIILIGASVSYFGSERSIYYLERSRLAHEQLQLYVSIAKKSNWLLRNLYQDTLSDRSGDQTLNEELVAAIRIDVNKLHNLTAEEIAFVANDPQEKAEEAEESLRLIKIEAGLEKFLEDFETLKQESATLENPEVMRRLDAIASRFDREFMFYLADILADERGEVQRTDAQAQNMSIFLELLATANAALSLPIILLMLTFLSRGINRAFAQLSEGAASLTRGEMEHRLPQLDDPELDRLGHAFNQMAEELSRNRQHLIDTNNSLERIVNERTQELEAANQTLADADRLRRRFFADISHELRTPLTVIRGEAEITLRGGDKTSGDYQACLRRIVDQADHTSRLVDDLLFMARANAGQPRLDATPVAINELLQNVAEDFKAFAGQRQITLQTNLAEDHLVVLGDRRRLRQVFSVVIDNAVRYSSECGTVTIRSAPGPRGVVVTVNDGGIGIAKEELAHVFERYYRGNNASQNKEGMGLGLPVAKAIVDAHNGQIDIDSTLGEGATVTIVLPREGELQSVA